MKRLTIILFLFPFWAMAQEDKDQVEAVFGDEIVATIELKFTPNAVTGTVQQVQYGVPTSSISQDRDYLIAALGKGREVAFTFSIHDPLMVYLDEGPDDNAKEQSQGAVVYVHIPYTEGLQSLRITGQTEKTKGMKAEIKIGDEIKDAYARFRNRQ